MPAKFNGQNLLSKIDWAAAENEAVDLLSRYLQFDTTNPPGNEAPAIEFLAETLRERGFEPQIIESAPGRANLITRLPGSGQAQAPPCLLYTHADVVPADPAGWSQPPFGGQVKDGFVWGRGAIDNKGLGVIFLQVLTLLKRYAPPLNREIILLTAADEEACGGRGVAWLLEHHPDLIKAEYVWDEGGVGLQQPLAPDHYLYQIAIAEKGALTVKLVAHGTPGHASIPQPGNPLERLVQALARLKRWPRPARLTAPLIDMLQALAPSRAFPHSALFAQAGNELLWPLLRSLLAKEPLFAPLIRNTVSLTMLGGGQKSNVIPAQAEARLDIRLLPGEDPQAILAALKTALKDPAITVVAEELPVAHNPTSSQTGFFQTLAQTLQTLGPPGLIVPYLTPGATDSRFFRRAGMKAYGFVPMLLDHQELGRIHGIDERVSAANLRWGMQVVFETLCRL